MARNTYPIRETMSLESLVKLQAMLNAMAERATHNRKAIAQVHKGK